MGYRSASDPRNQKESEGQKIGSVNTIVMIIRIINSRDTKTADIKVGTNICRQADYLSY